MILSDIKNYLLVNRRASVQELSEVFMIAPSALEPMLSRLEGKGYIQRAQQSACAENLWCATKETGCCSCPFAASSMSLSYSNIEILWTGSAKKNA
ncbi:MAG: FeoC-like transcriptional regulator [Alphaproteobacteria bacterium]